MYIFDYILANKYMSSKVKKKKGVEVGTTACKLKELLCRMEKFYLVGITGRTSFILENMDAKKFKITIGNDLKCSCSTKNQQCIHTIYVLT